MPDERLRPWPANCDDGCGNYSYERGRISFWADPRKWTIGVEIPGRQCEDFNGCRVFLVFHLGPFWIAWETTRDW